VSPETESDAIESKAAWIAGTLWRVALAAIVTVILANAVQTYFLDRTIPGVTSGAVAAVIGSVAVLRRRHLVPTSKAENNA
jgi:membrane associated rhomboid family serine protease